MVVLMSRIWYPFTQMKTAPAPLRVKGGKGALITLEDGRQLIDCISSWWVNLLGHCHPEIAQAIFEQSQVLEHVIFAGFTHEPAERLAEKLLSHLPQNLKKIFYSDNGSTAVEIALKIAYQYFLNKGEERSHFLCFDGAYHGDTIGAMSLGAHHVFTRIFEKLLFKKTTVPYPAESGKEEEILAFVREELGRGKYAAVVIEPLVQGVSGMQMCRPSFLRRLAAAVKEQGVLLIYDEVMTGFGRTGDWFACVKTQTEPDLICLAKGLTGGFLPLAVTACSDEVYNAFFSDDLMHTFFHGHSYTANPLGCAAALKTLELLEKNPACFMEMEQRHRPFLQELGRYPLFQNIRVCGTIVAMEIGQEGGYLNDASHNLREYFLERGLLMRPLGNTLYLMPPYCITEGELTRVYEAILGLHDRFGA